MKLTLVALLFALMLIAAVVAKNDKDRDEKGNGKGNGDGGPGKALGKKRRLADDEIDPEKEDRIKKHNDEAKEGKHKFRKKKNKFAGKSRNQKKKRLGAKKSKIDSSKLLPPDVAATLNIPRSKRAVLPENFDARQIWPACVDIFNHVRDQGECGSCWAHAVASALSDRICIKSGGAVKKRLSVQDQLSCMPSDLSSNSNNCDGLSPEVAYRMFINVGITTGGNVDQQDDGCMPYSTKAFLNGSSVPICPLACSNPSYLTPKFMDKTFGSSILIMGHDCASLAVNGANTTYNMVPGGKWGGYLSQNTGTMADVDTLIKTEIMNNGPVAAVFDVYDDLFDYDDGVYEKDIDEDDFIGGHAVKVIGWGVDNDVPYWLAANSWGTDWGQQGYFKIVRGKNHLNIESWIVSGTVK